MSIPHIKQSSLVSYYNSSASSLYYPNESRIKPVTIEYNKLMTKKLYKNSQKSFILYLKSGLLYSGLLLLVASAYPVDPAFYLNVVSRMNEKHCIKFLQYSV